MQPALDRQAPLPTTPAPTPVRAPEFAVGRVIGRTFSTWWRNVVPFTLLTLVAYLPIIAAMVLGGADALRAASPAPDALDPAAAPAAPSFPASLAIAYVVSMLLFAVEVGAMTHGVIQHLAGKRVSFGAMIAAGLRRALPVVVVGLLCYLVIAMGTVLLVFPGVYLACMLAVAIPASVVERPGLVGALNRSAEITKGKRFAVFTVFLAVFLVAFTISMFGTVLLPQLTASVSPILGMVLGMVVNAVFGTVVWVAPGVVYHDLRVAKEGVATAQLAAVFE